ncbi:hypothetical protein HU200_014912 [Digitaria exilis]|uniref:VWA-Hint protein Vwaint domain-containing protein n=1 Tax=Digitaria exilis TaxID=1010633 RepID=A0A835FAM3_9POAL|nr:hypothetical protein HU200_014912 [Digitaria exilis]
MQTISNAKNVDASQVAIYTFGFGNDSDNNLLSDIALKSHDLQLKLKPLKDDGDIDTIVVAPGTDYTQSVDPTTGVIVISFGTIFSGESRKVILTLTLKNSTVTTSRYDAELADAQNIFTAQGKRHVTGAPEAELAPRAEADAIRQARLKADAGDLDEARYTLVDAQSALEHVVLSDGQKLVKAVSPQRYVAAHLAVNTLLRAELVQLVKLMDNKGIYESKGGRAYALASEASHGRQRYAARGGGEDDDVRLFSTPPMDSYLEQAKNFEKDPTVTVPSAAEDVKREVAAVRNHFGYRMGRLMG